MRAKKCALAVILSLCMVLTLIPGLAFADGGETDQFSAIQTYLDGTLIPKVNTQIEGYANIKKEESGYTINISNPTKDDLAAMVEIIGGILKGLQDSDYPEYIGLIKPTSPEGANCTVPSNKCTETDGSLLLSKLLDGTYEKDGGEPIEAFCYMLGIYNGSAGHINGIADLNGTSFTFTITNEQASQTATGTSSSIALTFKFALEEGKVWVDKTDGKLDLQEAETGHQQLVVTEGAGKLGAMSMSALKARLQNVGESAEIVFYDKDNHQVTTAGRVGTGWTISITDGENETIIDIVVMGDLDGNAKLDESDVKAMAGYMLGDSTLTGLYEQAAHVKGTETLTTNDIVLLLDSAVL